MPIGKCSRDGRGREVSKCGEVSERLKEHAWKVCKRVKPFRGFESRSLRQFSAFPDDYVADLYGGSVGPPATIACKLRQVRKEATVASDSGAGMWLAELPPFVSSRALKARLASSHPWIAVRPGHPWPVVRRCMRCPMASHKRTTSPTRAVEFGNACTSGVAQCEQSHGFQDLRPNKVRGRHQSRVAVLLPLSLG